MSLSDCPNCWETPCVCGSDDDGWVRLDDYSFCHQQPERIEGGNRLWRWFQVRCRNPRCVEHGTVRHLTKGRAGNLWNLRQAQQRNILKNAALAASHTEAA